MLYELGFRNKISTSCPIDYLALLSTTYYYLFIVHYSSICSKYLSFLSGSYLNDIYQTK